MSTGLDAFKKRGNSKFAQFHQPGATVAGLITEISDQKQAAKFNPDPKAKREPDFWPSGDPVMEVWVTVQTQERDPQDPEDSGLRTIVVTVNQKPGGQLAAIMDACEAIGAETPLPGGFLALTFTGVDPASKNPATPRKLFAAQYKAPAPGGGAFQQQAAPAPQAQPQYNEWNPAPPIQQQPPVQQIQQPAPGQQPAAPYQGGVDFAAMAAQQQQQPPAWAQQPAAPQQYQPPVPVNTHTGEVGLQQGGYQQAPAPQAQQAAPAQQQAPSNWDANAVQSLIAQGMDDQTISSTTGAPLQAVAAIRSMP